MSTHYGAILATVQLLAVTAFKQEHAKIVKDFEIDLLFVGQQMDPSSIPHIAAKFQNLK